MQENLLAARALPWTPLREHTALPQPQLVERGLAAPLQLPHPRSFASDPK